MNNQRGFAKFVMAFGVFCLGVASVFYATSTSRHHGNRDLASKKEKKPSSVSPDQIRGKYATEGNFNGYLRDSNNLKRANISDAKYFSNEKMSGIYNELFPYYAQICTGTRLAAKQHAILGGNGGHATFFLKGACMDHSKPFPQIKMCPPVSDVNDRRHLDHPDNGVAVSLNMVFKNLQWVAIPGRSNFFFGPGEKNGNYKVGKIDQKAMKSAVDYYNKQPWFDGIIYDEKLVVDLCACKKLFPIKEGDDSLPNPNCTAKNFAAIKKAIKDKNFKGLENVTNIKTTSIDDIEAKKDSFSLADVKQCYIQDYLGIDFATSYVRDQYCARLPMPKDAFQDVIDHVNKQNEEWYWKFLASKGGSRYEWHVLTNNCSHLIHNAYAKTGVVAAKPVKNSISTPSPRELELYSKYIRETGEGETKPAYPVKTVPDEFLSLIDKKYTLNQEESEHLKDYTSKVNKTFKVDADDPTRFALKKAKKHGKGLIQSAKTLLGNNLSVPMNNFLRIADKGFKDLHLAYYFSMAADNKVQCTLTDNLKEGSLRTPWISAAPGALIEVDRIRPNNEVFKLDQIGTVFSTFAIPGKKRFDAYSDPESDQFEPYYSDLCQNLLYFRERYKLAFKKFNERSAISFRKFRKAYKGYLERQIDKATSLIEKFEEKMRKGNSSYSCKKLDEKSRERLVSRIDSSSFRNFTKGAGRASDEALNININGWAPSCNYRRITGYDKPQ